MGTRCLVTINSTIRVRDKPGIVFSHEAGNYLNVLLQTIVYIYLLIRESIVIVYLIGVVFPMTCGRAVNHAYSMYVSRPGHVKHSEDRPQLQTRVVNLLH